MASVSSSGFITNSDIDEFLAALTSKDRLKILNKWRTQSLKIEDNFLRGILKFPLSQDEVIAAFDLCETHNRASFELWIMENILTWEQNVAASAIRAWERTTDRILWHRLVPIASSPGLPQRIRFTILDIAPSSHGFELVKATLLCKEWEDLSPAFHALMFERCLQFELIDIRLDNIAWKILDQNKHISFPEDKSLLPAIGWLCRHKEKELEKWTLNSPKVLWVNILSSVLETHGRRGHEISKIEKIVLKANGQPVSSLKLPALWSRGELKNEIYKQIIKFPKTDASLLDGIPAAVISQEDCHEASHNSWMNNIIGRLPLTDPACRMKNLSSSFGRSYDQTRFSELHEARLLATNGKLGIATDKITRTKDFSDEEVVSSPITHAFASFINVLISPQNQIDLGENPWHLLAKAWISPASADLNALTTATRKGRGLLALAHIMVMSRMNGRDEAVLKLLDHIRSTDETEIRSVVRALGMINTPRSLLELISMLTRPNTSIQAQQDIVNVLAGKDLTSLQNEIRSAVHDLNVPENTEHPLFQIRDEISAMLHTREKPTEQVRNADTLADSQGGNLDQELGGMIPYYNSLSSEVKRALRTALFFNKTVTDSKHANSIDLSPLIDMQYKAMELLYREFFEDTVSQVLQKGVIQRKLDVIGYARPIMRNMDDFEAFIATLPVVKEIPFFSKFKLRKMLRALCQFEPGKRFTLDGLKAFGLFFLVFGRQNCRHGLEGLVITAAKDDRELAEFCRELHIFQDFRNRAAHEGFHPDASNDILGIWRTTALVVQWAFRTKDAQKTASLGAVKQAS